MKVIINLDNRKLKVDKSQLKILIQVLKARYDKPIKHQFTGSF